GEAQRAVLARALAQEAPVLLLDEPTSSLDIGHAIEVLELVDQLRRQMGLTVVTAIHDLTLAGRFARRLVMLADGRVVADGPPATVLTEERLVPHYGAGIRVISDGDGPSVIPTRSAND
ncbi:MAG: ABC transporter ATP-binding protein, partial [Acidimicrobiia bacterium]